MRILTHETDVSKLDKRDNDWFYNGMDCCVTRQLHDVLLPMVEKRNWNAYEYERAMLGPSINMMLRGIRIDAEASTELIARLKEQEETYLELFYELCNAINHKAINHKSPVQLKELFYKALDIPEVKKRQGNVWKVSTDREALEKIAKESTRGVAFAKTILKLRDIDKQLQVLTATRDPDGRIRTSFNVAGTETWRFSSSESPAYSGINFQNVTERLRKVFVPDEGMAMFYADLDQAESRVVAYLSGDVDYINACESGDLHTTVVKMVWPNMGWTGDAEADREMAERSYIRQYSFRDVCKRAGHGTNYGLRPASLARHLSIKVREAVRFQLQYYGGEVDFADLERWHEQDRDGGFDSLIDEGTIVGVAPRLGEKDKRKVEVRGAFPGIRLWQDRTFQELELKGELTNPFGFKRQFWDRLTEQSTQREAIAFLPQSTVGILTNIGIYRLHYELPDVEMLANVHDAALGQFPIKEIDNLAPLVINCMQNSLVVNGRTLVIPSSIEVGMNWGHQSDDNPNGMHKWEG